jgi:hypothetical protein
VRKTNGYPKRLLALTIALLAGCQSKPSLPAHRLVDLGTAHDVAVRAPVIADADELAALVRPGDLILGAKSSPTATLLRMSMDEYSFYTHSGVVDVRDGKVVVSHSTGRFQLLRNTTRLLGKVTGTVEACSLATFLEEYDEVMVVRLPDPERNARLVALSLEAERDRIPFDPFFDTNDPTAMHCSEYTLRTLRAAGYTEPLPLADRTPNRSFSDLMEKMGITTETFVVVDRMTDIPGARTVAVLSRLGSRAASLALRDALHVLHDRVTADPFLRIGDLVSCDSEQLLHYAPAADLYLRAALGLAESSPTGDPRKLRERSTMLYDVISRPYVRTYVAEGDAAASE